MTQPEQRSWWRRLLRSMDDGNQATLDAIDGRVDPDGRCASNAVA